MTGPLEHFMPVIAANRHRQINDSGDPYFDDVTFLTQFRGRPDDNLTMVNPELDIPLDTGPYQIPLFIVGSPIRFPHAGDGMSAAVDGVSNSASYYARTGIGYSSAVVVGANSYINLSNSDFEIKIRVRGTNTDACNFAGRWVGGGGKSWALSYYKAMKTINFSISRDGSLTHSDPASFRLNPSLNDGLSVAEFFDGNWHEIIVSRSADIISISVDGHAGHEIIKMADIETRAIFDPPSDNALLQIGSVPADMTGFRTSLGNFRGWIDYFEMYVDGDPVLKVHFNEYWSYWWVGKYFHDTHMVNGVNWEGSAFQNEEGFKKNPIYVGPSWPYHSTLDFESEDFTVEIFGLKCQHNNLDIQNILGMGWSFYKCWRFLLKPIGGNNSPGRLVFQWTTDNITVHEIIAIDNIPIGTQITGDLTAVRFGSTISVFLNGELLVREAISGSIYSGNFGQVPLTLYNTQSSGDLCDPVTKVLSIRVTKGVARYRGTHYRVPTLPLPKYTA